MTAHPRRCKTVLAALTGALLLASTAAFAQSIPSTKSAASTMDSVLVAAVTASNQSWTPVLSTQIKTSEQKDLYMGVSLVTSLLTQTLVKSKGGNQDTSTAEALVEVQVVVNPGTPAARIAAPGAVIYDRRRQELMAKFGGTLNCSDANGDGIVSFTECTLTDEELNLILMTEASHHFNFIMDDLGSGVHTIQVQARILSSNSAQAGAASAQGFIGKGSLTVEEVRLGRDVSF